MKRSSHCIIYNEPVQASLSLFSGVTKEAVMESDPLRRAEIMLQQADKLGCRSFISVIQIDKLIYNFSIHIEFIS